MLETRHAIAAEVRAELARQRKSARDVSPVLNLAHNTLILRLNGEVAFRGEELVALADHFGVPVERFMRAPAGRTTEAAAA